MTPALDLTSITLKVMFIIGLILASGWIILPFLPAAFWAMTLVIATWPIMLAVQKRCSGRRGCAVALMISALLLLVLVPLGLAISTVVDNLDQISDLASRILSLHVPAPPPWLAGVPLVGARAVDMWTKVAGSGLDELAPKLAPYAGRFTQWLAATAGSVGGLMLHLVVTTILATLMFLHGEKAADTAVQFGRRLGGDRGHMAVRLAGNAIRSVALGVVVTALAQTLISGVGLLVAGVPFAALLTAMMFVLCLVQLGPGLVLVPAVIWMYVSGDTLYASVLLAFTLVATTIDQFIRPVLIRKGADLPLLLILGGVLGGLVAFGMLGIFIGPSVLAVAYTLLDAWLADGREAPRRS